MTVGPIRMTTAVFVVLRVFLADVSQPRYGYELMGLTGYPSGKLYPILARLRAAKWLDKRREDSDPSMVGHPTRYWYRLTPEGVAAARREVAIMSQHLSISPLVDSSQPQVGLA